MLGSVVEIDGAPLNVKDPIGRSAGHRDVDAAGPARIAGAAGPTHIIRPQILPVGEDGVVVAVPWQADISEGILRGRKLGIAVGRQSDARVSLIVERERKGERNVGDYVIPVIAGVCRARDTTAAYLIYRVLADARCWRRTGRSRRRRRWCRHIPRTLD